jgi:general stress protein 26
MHWVRTSPVPRQVRPKFPEEWQVPNEPRLWITWAHANEKLREEQVYWVSTSSNEGRPHAAPVWGIWKADRFFFETDPKSVKARNLKANSGIVVHIQDGLDTVIVEGTATLEADPKELYRLRKDYIRMYDYEPDWSDKGRQVVFRVLPRVVHAWRAPKMHRNLVNFLFQPGRRGNGA